MTDYILAVGPHDPLAITAADDAEASRQAGVQIEGRFAAVLRDNPETVVSLIGPGGLLTLPGERIDDFVRLSGMGRVVETDDLQLAESPDCNVG